MIGGVAGVEADVIPFGSVLGNRARLVGLNVVGLQPPRLRARADPDLRAAFRLLFRGAGVFAERVAIDVTGSARNRWWPRCWRSSTRRPARPDPQRRRSPTTKMLSDSMSDRPALGILAGGGPLARRASPPRPAPPGGRCSSSRSKATPTPPCSPPIPTRSLRMGAAGAHPRRCCATNGCRELVLVGPVPPPSLLDFRPDAAGARLLARIGRAAFAGDDGLLKAVVRVLGGGRLPRPRRARIPHRDRSARAAC